MTPDYIGTSAPVQRVAIRPGVLSRGYVFIGTLNARTPMMANFPMKANVGDSAQNPEYPNAWTATWMPTGAYVDIPNVLEVKLGEKNLSTQGVDIASVEIENILYPDAGGYFKRQRGALSPLRGVNYGGFTLTDEDGVPVPPNEWSGRFLYAAQITVWQGWGEAATKTFTGLIEDSDSTSRPDRITLTARSFGQVLTDTPMLSPAVDPYTKSPIIFADRKEGSLLRISGKNATSSTNKPLAPLVTDEDATTSWESVPGLSATPTQLEFVEIGLDEGLYQSFEMEVPAAFAGMEMWVSLHPQPATSGSPHITRDAEELIGGPKIDGGGWIDLGKGTINDGAGGEATPWIAHYPNVPAEKLVLDLEAGSHNYVFGTNTVMRLSFSKMPAVAPGKFAAAVATLFGLRQTLKGGEEGAAVRNHWVLVDDISDVVKLLCAWAGFKEWEIEDTGVALPTLGGEMRKRLSIDETKSFMDVIKELELGCGFSFFMKDPTAAEDSLGVPCWRKTRVVTPLGMSVWEAGGKVAWAAAATVTDRTLLTAIEMKQSSEELRDVIRVYGQTKAGKRIVYTYFPPWNGARLGGVLKQLSHKDELFATIADCQFAAFFMALQEALDSIEATIEVPGYPGFDLDEHIVLLDLGTGLSTRLAVMGRSSVMVSGEKAKWVSTLRGALIDTPDVHDMVAIINANGAGASGVSGGWGAIGGGTPSSLGYG